LKCWVKEHLPITNTTGAVAFKNSNIFKVVFNIGKLEKYLYLPSTDTKKMMETETKQLVTNF